MRLNWEEVSNREAKENNKVTLDFITKGFWLNGQTGFFDGRAFDPSARLYSN